MNQTSVPATRAARYWRECTLALSQGKGTLFLYKRDIVDARPGVRKRRANLTPHPLIRLSLAVDQSRGSGHTELMVALHIGSATGSSCDTDSPGAVTTKVPSRGQAFPVPVSIA